MLIYLISKVLLYSFIGVLNLNIISVIYPQYFHYDKYFKKVDLEKQSDSLDKMSRTNNYLLNEKYILADKVTKKYLLQRFHNLSINCKLFIALFACELIPFVGFFSTIFTNIIIKENTQIENKEKALVFLQQESGDFVLATDTHKNKLEFDDKSILLKAVDNPGKEVSQEIKIDGKNYKKIAKTINNTINQSITGSKPIAILVETKSASNINNLLLEIFIIQLLCAVFGLFIVLLWTRVFKETLLKHVEQIKQTAEKIADGDISYRVNIYSQDELGQLAIAFNKMADSICEQNYYQSEEVKISKLVNKITERLRESLDSEQILKSAVIHTREALEADRVIIFSFDENWQGHVVAESVDSNCLSILDSDIYDPCFAESYVEKYQQGRISAIEDIYIANLGTCHINLLEKFSVRANLVAPILINNKLYGLLIAHQCYRPRQWQQSEINLLKAVAIPVGFTLEQVQSFAEQQARQEAEKIYELQHQQKEELQNQIRKLIRQIEGAARGDLTVEADVTGGELGIVARECNSIIYNLREIVTKVKESAFLVNTAISADRQAIGRLSLEALQQAEDTNRTLYRIDRMREDVESVAENAQKAAQVSRSAARAAIKSGEAMNSTVKNISSLKETIVGTVKKVKCLGKSSGEISHVVSLIERIAVKTNLLAINVGLEAARNSDDGDTFAVIAREVGELAARCTDATQEIQQIVERIQQETNEVIQAMEVGSSQMVEGTRVLEETKISLGQIVNNSQQIDALVDSISKATVSQVHSAQVVTQLMQQIAEVAKNTSGSSREVSESLQNTVKISQQLKATVETFRVG